MEGFPYVWLQVVGFPSKEDQESNDVQVMKEWVELITRIMYQRWRDRMTLLKQLADLQGKEYFYVAMK
jgi:hypothetical protein